MDHILNDSDPQFIVMTVTGVVDKAGIIAALSKLLTHPDYKAKHTMWDFTGATMGLSLGDFREIAGVLGLFKPRTEHFANRSALVVPHPMERNMAKVYVSISKVLPFDYRVFQTREAAREFLTA